MAVAIIAQARGVGCAVRGREERPDSHQTLGGDVPKLTFLGEEMGHASYMDVRSQVSQKARVEWNALD